MLFDIVIIFFIILYIKAIFFKSKPAVLFCGIFAFISDDPSKFNNHIFDLLGIKNDSRGGDAVGIYYDDKLLKSVQPSYYEDFAVKNRITNLQIPFVLGHTRKGSPGMGKTLSQAQPIEIKEGNDFEIVLAHNGTLYNETKLASKHGIPSSGQTDTQILTEIIAKHGYKDVLEEYYGSAALIWKNFKEDCIYVFHGASPSSYNGSLVEERPLYWIREDKTIYISSLKEPLKFINHEAVEEVPHNTLYKIKNGKIFSHVKINRSSVGQTKVLFNSSEYTSNRHSSSNKNNPKNNTPVVPKDIKQIDIMKPGEYYIQNKAMFSKGRYYIKSKIMHGQYELSGYGYLKGDIDQSEVQYFALDFFEGNMIFPNSFSFLAEELRNAEKNGAVTKDKYLEILAKYAIDGYDVPYDSKYGTFQEITGDFREAKYPSNLGKSNNYYSGTFRPHFSNYVYHFSVGSLNQNFGKDAADKLPNYHKLTVDTYTEWIKYAENNLGIKAPDSITNAYTKDKDKDCNTEENDNPEEHMVTCPECLGEGHISHYSGQYESCDLCDGDGLITKEEYESYLNLAEETTQDLRNKLLLTDIGFESYLGLHNLFNLTNSFEKTLNDYYDQFNQAMDLIPKNIVDLVDDIQDKMLDLGTLIEKLKKSKENE